MHFLLLFYFHSQRCYRPSTWQWCWKKDQKCPRFSRDPWTTWSKAWASRTQHTLPGYSISIYIIWSKVEADQCLTINLLKQNSSFSLSFAKFSSWWRKCCTLMLNYLSVEEVPICVCEWWSWGPSSHGHMQPLSVWQIQKCANICEGIWCLIWFDGTLIMTTVVLCLNVTCVL